MCRMPQDTPFRGQRGKGSAPGLADSESSFPGPHGVQMEGVHPIADSRLISVEVYGIPSLGKIAEQDIRVRVLRDDGQGYKVPAILEPP